VLCSQMDADLLLFFKATAHVRGVFGDMIPGVLLGFRVLWDCIRVSSARARRELGVLRLLVALVWV
jgi:hypothetical protein